jgi:hypothetical protein
LNLGGLLSDVIIAFCNETWWIVKGVAHLDDVLAGNEPPALTISLVTCDKWPDLMKLWEAPEIGQLPWAINPKVIERLKTRPQTTLS